MFARGSQALAFCSVVLLGGASVAQEDPQAAARDVQAKMLQAQDRLLAAARAGAGSERAAPLCEEACALYAQVLEALPKLEGVSEGAIVETRRIALYNTACGRALQGKAKESLDALGKALEAGYDDLERIERDPDLAGVREDPRYVQLLERERAKILAEAKQAERPLLSEGPLFPYDFAIKTLDGKELKLADLKGKVVIVDYWGTWCPPCRKEIPHFLKLKEEFKDRLAIVGMTWERGNGDPDTKRRVRRFAERFKVTYPLTLVTQQADLAKVPGLDAFPTTLFIDAQGRVRAKEVGYRDFETLHRLVHALEDDGKPEGAREGHVVPPTGEPERAEPEAPQPERRSF
jgi:thiol-disulfide isomerase/thioredoxin